jgi:dihydrofolate reductase
MRSLVLSSFLSLDGYSFDPGTEIYRLLEDIDDPEQDEYFVGRLRAAGTHIMGRVTYEEMAKACCPPPPETACRCSPARPRSACSRAGPSPLG